MINISRRSMLKSGVTFSGMAAVTGLGPRSAAAFTPPSFTPADLASKLMPLGGERAGNSDNTIPAWTGGYSELPAGFQPGDTRPIPFANEKPLFSITASNYTQYEDKLSVGQIQFFKLYSDFRMDVYPTHRTAIAPQYVYDYTAKNATTAQLSSDGNAVTGAYGGVPFPIPANGHQVVWNHLLAWRGVTINDAAMGVVVTDSGQQVITTVANAIFQYPYYINGGESKYGGYYTEFYVDPTAPPSQAGGALVLKQAENPLSRPTRGWLYLIGERRVRLAPELSYDTPNNLVAGVENRDEFELFYGAIDRYDCAIVGKKEMYVPYNVNKAWATPVAEQCKTKFFNPDICRWELHRVWIVEMTVKQGARNVDARRTLYIDEDTWNALMSDVYDSGGNYWKFLHMVPVICADIPCMVGSQFCEYDLHAGDWTGINVIDPSIRPQYMPIPPKPESYFTPGQLAASSGGF